VETLTPEPLPAIPADLRHPCETAPPAPRGDLQTLTENHSEAMKLADDCRKRHAKLAAAVAERERLERERAERAAREQAAAAAPTRRWRWPWSRRE
jgi:hypothetical protein